jgi:hypothetical protein
VFRSGLPPAWSGTSPTLNDAHVERQNEVLSDNQYYAFGLGLRSRW